ncbi:hypothetical protein Syun_025126 [Stephania yunnanensis]|uniref:Uncharacterized protein n=1 Tax=Stephania yunnanensis TaxID=152371 RepID=A0AAP0ERJ8_9MAGN
MSHCFCVVSISFRLEYARVLLQFCTISEEHVEFESAFQVFIFFSFGKRVGVSVTGFINPKDVNEHNEGAQAVRRSNKA